MKATTFIRQLGLSDIGFSASIYGKLYNWYCISNPLFAPNSDWKIPTFTEFEVLTTNVGGYLNAGGELKETTYNHWLSPNTGATNNYNYKFMPNGHRAGSGNFIQRTMIGGVWTITEQSSQIWVYEAWYNLAYRTISLFNKNYGFGVRFLWCGTGTPSSTISDYEGRIYNVINIGSQYWLKQNWASSKYSDGNDIPNVTDNSAWTALTSEAYCNYNNDPNNI